MSRDKKTRTTPSVWTACALRYAGDTKGSRLSEGRATLSGTDAPAGVVEPSRWTSGGGPRLCDLGMTVDSNTPRQTAREWCARGPLLLSYPDAAVEAGDGSAGVEVVRQSGKRLPVSRDSRGAAAPLGNRESARRREPGTPVVEPVAGAVRPSRLTTGIRAVRRQRQDEPPIFPEPFAPNLNPERLPSAAQGDLRDPKSGGFAEHVARGAFTLREGGA